MANGEVLTIYIILKINKNQGWIKRREKGGGYAKRESLVLQ